MNREPPSVALVLSGGGARAAYQVGVLRAVARLARGPRRPRAADGAATPAAAVPTPFPIICGTSAGAINAAMLAAHADDFRAGVARLLRLWRKLRIADVYLADLETLSRHGLRWLAAVVTGKAAETEAASMLDNAPLRSLVAREIDFSRIARCIAGGALEALTINATSYRTGQAVTFVQGRDATPWARVRRHAEAASIGTDHLMASVAIPFIFPATRLGEDWYMDGSVRQIAPLAPALHLGATRLFVVAVGHFFGGPPASADAPRPADYPSFAQTASHALSSIFVDNLAADLERLEALNRLIARMPAEAARAAGADVGHVDAMLVSPSIDLGAHAIGYAGLLPAGVRAMLRSLGAMQESGATMMSYLMFDRSFCRELIRLGYADAMGRRDAIIAFLHGEPVAQLELPRFNWA